MRDPAQVIKDLLVVAGVGVFNANTGWSINIGELRDSPDTIILVNCTGGKSPYPHLLINEPSVQVVVRSGKSGYVTARAKANNIVNILLGMSSVVDPASGDNYKSCVQIGDISYLGQDDNTRAMFSINFSFIVLPAAEVGGNRVVIT